jgi:hypothetical protein
MSFGPIPMKKLTQQKRIARGLLRYQQEGYVHALSEML